MDPAPSTLEVIARLALAVLAGGLVGFEREWRHKPAGLRTHMLVCLGAATFTLVTADLYAELNAAGASATRLDPMRLIQGVIGGIGFLGAGSILHARGAVHGLTTAGGIWLVGALGIAIGSGDLRIAVSALALALIVLYGFGKFERWLSIGHAEDAPEDRGRPAG